jgi:hypothetical protein
MDALKKRLAECDEERVKQMQKEIETLKQKVYALENATLKSCAFPDPFVIDDAAFAAEANAPPTPYKEEKAVNEIIMPIIKEEKDTKIVKMVGEKTKKEYQREYQRAYRKKQKSMTMNV